MRNFGIFLSEFGCHGNSLRSLENSDNIPQVADHENLCTGKISQFLAQKKIKSVQFWLIVA